MVELTGLLASIPGRRDPDSTPSAWSLRAAPSTPKPSAPATTRPRAAFYPLEALPTPLAFDHADILTDFCLVLAGKRTLAGLQPPVPLNAAPGGEV